MDAGVPYEQHVVVVDAAGACEDGGGGTRQPEVRTVRLSDQPEGRRECCMSVAMTQSRHIAVAMPPIALG